jgi:4-amino-4-deoxy-L-arabinose transferase-like glycosyltransferase
MEHRMNLNKLTRRPLPMASPSHIRRAELIFLLLLLLLGFTLRVWNISSVGLDHFDEGVYVFSALSLTDAVQPSDLYPGQVKFSPPVFFSLIGLSYYFSGGPSVTAAIFLNILLGTLAILVIWWIGRVWFGATVGIAAAVLLAFSEYHIMLSRTALTDVAFALFFLTALGISHAALKRRSIGLSVIAGFAVGLAWNTKYHGWFALLIAGSALVPVSLQRRAESQPYGHLFFHWGIMVAVAVACYLPWALFIQSEPGGYVALAKYQRTMLSLDWFHNFWHQAQMQLFLEGPLSRFSVIFAFFCVVSLSSARRRLTSRFLLIIILLPISAILIGSSGTASLLALLAIPMLLRKPLSLSSWLVLAWLAVWFFSTPLYRPYARLLLPYNIATYLVAGIWMSAMVNQPHLEARPFAWRLVLPGIVALVVIFVAFLLPDFSNPWRPSLSVSQAASAMKRLIPPKSRVMVVGEPALEFYLHLTDLEVLAAVENNAARVEFLKGVREPLYLITGVYAKRAPDLRQGLEKLNGRLESLGTFSMHPKDVRILDDFDPQKAKFFLAAPDSTYDLTLYQLLPSTHTLSTEGKSAISGAI